MIYTWDSQVRYSEVDVNGRLGWAALLDYFQNCSVFQSESLGAGVSHLYEQNMAWMLSAWQIRINQLPKLMDKIQVKTWAYDMKAFYGYRNFAMDDERGNRLAYANSIWILVDTKTGRPIRVPDEVTALYGHEEPLPMECNERKIPIPNNCKEYDSIPVQSYFIDTNHHMNNGKYVMIAQEFIPQDFITSEIRVEYRKAAKRGDILYPHVAVAEDRITVLLCNEEEKPYAVIAFLSEKDS